MCVLCLDFKLGKLSIEEAFQNLDEMESVMSDEHYDEVTSMLNDAIEIQALNEMASDNSFEDNLSVDDI